MLFNPLKAFNEYISLRIQNIEKRQQFYNLLQLLLAALNIGLCSYLLGIPLLTFLYSNIVFNIPIDISVCFITFSAFCFALFDLGPIYYNKIIKIDSFPLSLEKKAFIKTKIAQLTQKAGIAAPEIYVDQNKTSINAEFKWSLFTPGKIILTAGLLRSFGFGITSKRDMNATLAHELGHKIGKDIPLLIVQAVTIATTVGIYLSLILAMIDASLKLMSLSLMTFTSIIPVTLTIVGVLIYGAISSSLFLQYRKDMESAADIRGVHLTNDVQGMTESNKHFKTQDRNLAVYTWLSYFDNAQVRKFLSSVKAIGSYFQYKHLKNILTQKLPFKEKQKTLLNSSFLDKDWRTKFKAPAQHVISKHYDALLERSKECHSTENKSYFTRFNRKLTSIMNPYPSTKERNRNVHKNFNHASRTKKK
jgi:Zn-dependent protease with chaperone function